MMSIDFHGHTVEEAVRTAEKIICTVRMNKEEKHYSFITGRGVIKQRLSEVLREHGLEPVEPMANGGIIEVEIS